MHCLGWSWAWTITRDQHEKEQEPAFHIQYIADDALQNNQPTRSSAAAYTHERSDAMPSSTFFFLLNSKSLEKVMSNNSIKTQSKLFSQIFCVVKIIDSFMIIEQQNETNVEARFSMFKNNFYTSQGCNNELPTVTLDRFIATHITIYIR